MKYKCTFSILFACAWAIAISIGSTAAWAQTSAEQMAAKATYIDGLRLLNSAEKSSRLALLGIDLAYVENDSRPGGGKYLCGALSRDVTRAAGSAIASALSKLSDAALSKLGLKYVVLCSRVLAGGQAVGGIPVPPLNLLMLNVDEHGGNTPYQQYIFLHELYHLIEFKFNSYQDAEWQQLFGAAYANSYEGKLKRSAIGSGKRGFLNAYAETYPHEDRAELFASLLLDPAGVFAQMRDDVLLQKKVRYMAEKCERLMGLRIVLSGR
jgi:hypothetical protein